MEVATALMEVPVGHKHRKRLVAEQMVPVISPGDTPYNNKGKFDLGPGRSPSAWVNRRVWGLEQALPMSVLRGAAAVLRSQIAARGSQRVARLGEGGVYWPLNFKPQVGGVKATPPPPPHACGVLLAIG
jgi:hypothetical protein